MVGTELQQVGVDELAAVVRVDAQHREREPGHDVLECGQDPFLGFVAYGADLGPAGGDVGDGQGGCELPRGVAALVGDQVDLHEPGPGLVPVGPGPDRDLGFQQRAGFGQRPAPGLPASPLGGQAAIDGGRGYPHQLVARVCSLRDSSPQAISRSTIWGRKGARRLPAGASSKAQTFRKAMITSVSYTGSRFFRCGATGEGFSAERRALRA